VFIALIYFAGMLIGSALAMPLGGVFNALFGILFTIPYLGRLFDFLLNRWVRVTVLGKLTAWAISASGPAVSYLILEHIFGRPHNNQWIAVVAAAAIVVSNISWRIISFQTFPVSELKDLPLFIRKRLPDMKPEDVATLMRMNFGDVNFTVILQLLFAFGTLLFVLVNLGVLAATAPNGGPLVSSPTLIDCLAVSFSFARIFDSPQVVFTGHLWQVLRFVAGVVLTVWTATFLAFARDMLPKRVPDRDDPPGLDLDQVRKIVDEAIADQMEAAAKITVLPSPSAPEAS
jgi:hypothetical protein